jgi:hypothetical protein
MRALFFTFLLAVNFNLSAQATAVNQEARVIECKMNNGIRFQVRDNPNSSALLPSAVGTSVGSLELTQELFNKFEIPLPKQAETLPKIRGSIFSEFMRQTQGPVLASVSGVGSFKYNEFEFRIGVNAILSTEENSIIELHTIFNGTARVTVVRKQSGSQIQARTLQDKVTCTGLAPNLQLEGSAKPNI